MVDERRLMRKDEAEKIAILTSENRPSPCAQRLEKVLLSTLSTRRPIQHPHTIGIDRTLDMLKHTLIPHIILFSDYHCEAHASGCDPNSPCSTDRLNLGLISPLSAKYASTSSLPTVNP